MQIILEIIIAACLVLLVYQDFKDRLVDWYIFPILFMSGITYDFQFSHQFNVIPLLIGIQFLGIQLLSITAYFSLKHKRLTGIIDTQIGLGDILCWFSLLPYFSVVNFIVFYISSLLLSILIYTLFLTKETIPLAGIQSLFFLIIFMIVSATDNITFLQSDSLLLMLFSK
jgi:hypothetical protein